MAQLIRLPRRIVGTAALTLGMALSLLLTGNAQASVTYCRSDPTVTLSNGGTVTMYADTETDASNLASVDYVLHVPAGVSITDVTYDQFESLESVALVQDQKPGAYRTSTTVTVESGAYDVTAYTSVALGKCDGRVGSKNGATGKSIALAFSC